MHNDLGRSVTWLFNSAEIQWSVNLVLLLLYKLNYVNEFLLPR